MVLPELGSFGCASVAFLFSNVRAVDEVLHRRLIESLEANKLANLFLDAVEKDAFHLDGFCEEVYRADPEKLREVLTSFGPDGAGFESLRDLQKDFAGF